MRFIETVESVYVHSVYLQCPRMLYIILYTYDLDFSLSFPFSRDSLLPLIMVLPRQAVILSDSETGGETVK